VATSTRAAAKALCGQLRRIANRPVPMDCDEAWRMEQRMMICTPYLFSCASSDDWDCVVFGDVQAALASQSFERMMRLYDQLRYVIVASGQHLGWRERLRLEALCGAEIYRQPGPGGRLAEATAILVRSPRCPVLPRRVDLEHKRSLWGNTSRNAGIAQLARR